MSPGIGLTTREVDELRTEHGFNELPQKQVSPALQLLGHFNGPIAWMIEAALLLSAAVRAWADFFIILTLLVANALIGFWEEYQAGNAIAALQAKLALRARVRRDGHWATLPARELVPGDLIRLRLGDIVPADAGLVEGAALEVDQSALTGESLPVTRELGEKVYSGSIVRRGECDATVTGTGTHTFFGKTAELVAKTHTVSHFQKAVLKVGNYLIAVAVVLVALILVVAIWRGDSLTATLQFALVLTIAAIPVAMPTVLSVTMAVGARLLAAKQAIVSRLSVIEEMAGVDVLCSDKTGTLTKNALTLGEVLPAEGVQAEQLIEAAALASREEDQDPIDLAVIAGVKDRSSLEQFAVTTFRPFDPVSKRSEATVRRDGRERRVTKGAAQVILGLSNIDAAERRSVEASIDALAVRGYRALAVGEATDGEWRFLGVLPLFDPPRDDSKATLEAANAMGVRVKMVTGDQLAIGREIAGQLGLGTRLLEAGALGGEGARLDALVDQADGFAQVFPEHKYHIVESLQRRGHIVGMTGDGVNDAPALKKADAGIAVSGATDAARAAADIVLLTPGLSVIIDAIRESRRIFQRMTSYATYRIAETIRVLLFMTLSILVFNFYPVTAIMIVLLALLNDGAILSIAFDNAQASERPEAWNMREVLTVASVLGVTGVVASFGLFYGAERYFHIDRTTIQSLLYLKLSVAGHMTIFLTRTRGPFWSSRPSKALLFAVLGTQVVATLIAVYGFLIPPIGWTMAAVVWGYAVAWWLINDAVKVATYRFLAHRPSHPKPWPPVLRRALSH